MSKLKVGGQGTVLPPSTLPAKKLSGDKLTLRIDAVNTDLVEIPEVRIVYPDGYAKWHQAEDIAGLMAKVSGTLKGRYGVEGFAIASTPGKLAKGEIKLTDVTYGQ